MLHLPQVLRLRPQMSGCFCEWALTICQAAAPKRFMYANILPCYAISVCMYLRLRIPFMNLTPGWLANPQNDKKVLYLTGDMIYSSRLFNFEVHDSVTILYFKFQHDSHYFLSPVCCVVYSISSLYTL